jgi:4-hydroxy-tetrahydrodipicolinate synthase
VTEAFRLQYRLLDLFDPIFGAGDFPEGFRLAAGLRGFDFGPGRQPLMPEQREKLEAAGLEIGRQLAAAGYAREPADR